MPNGAGAVRHIMSNLERLITDLKADEELRGKFQECTNKLRSDEKISMNEAVLRAAGELGYEISDEEVKQVRSESRYKQQLSDEELDSVAGGDADLVGLMWSLFQIFGGKVESSEQYF